uniref:Cathepsin X n=1 Tax=Tetraselmis sp. GSL018 TaxID=582737 RepID=A0A061QYU2_9CHLO
MIFGNKLCILVVAVVCARVLGHRDLSPSGGAPDNPQFQNARFYGYVRSRVPPKPFVSSPLPAETYRAEDLPLSFDWRNVNGNSYVTPSVNQHIPLYCGSCWIHGTSAAISDRIKVLRRGAFPDVMISRQNLVNCVPVAGSELEGFDGEHGGCSGGDPRDILSWMLDNKVPDETCQTYVAKNMQCDPYHICHNCEPDRGTCFPIAAGSYTGYKVSEWGIVTGEEAMMKEIFARGPIVCSIAATSEFDNNYPSVAARHEGVFLDMDELPEEEVNHNVEIIGWGETASGVKYWIGRNSWGTYWGEGGFFRLGRGYGPDRNLRVERDCQWMVPDWEDLDELLDGKFSGDYNHGLLPTNATHSNYRPVPSHKDGMPHDGAGHHLETAR